MGETKMKKVLKALVLFTLFFQSFPFDSHAANIQSIKSDICNSKPILKHQTSGAGAGKVNIYVKDVPDDVEASVGAFVPVNDNDDNKDGNVDCEYNKERSKANPHDRTPMHISFSSELKNSKTGISKRSPLIISIPRNSQGFRVWGSATGKDLLIDQSGTVSFASAGKVPPVIWLEGGGNKRKTGVTLLSASWNGHEDRIKITSVRTNLKLIKSPFFTGLLEERMCQKKGKKGNVSVVEPYEETTGGLLQVNTSGSLEKYVKLIVYGQNLPKGNKDMQLIWYSDNKIEIYSSKLKDKQYAPDEILPSGHVFPGVDKGTVFFVNAIAKSKSVNDIEIISCYISPYNTAMHEDVIKLTNINK
jgi:hypothetical protein